MSVLEFHRIPVISTGHLAKEVAEALTAQGDDNPWVCCAAWGYGYFLHLDDLESAPAPAPQCLIDIRDWMRAQEAAGTLDNSRWVRLDSDAGVVEGLATYDW